MPAIIESGAFRYESLQDWAQLPEGWSFIDASGVAVDSDDNVYVLSLIHILNVARTHCSSSEKFSKRAPNTTRSASTRSRSAESSTS